MQLWLGFYRERERAIIIFHLNGKSGDSNHIGNINRQARYECCILSIYRASSLSAPRWKFTRIISRKNINIMESWHRKSRRPISTQWLRCGKLIRIINEWGESLFLQGGPFVVSSERHWLSSPNIIMNAPLPQLSSSNAFSSPPRMGSVHLWASSSSSSSQA